MGSHSFVSYLKYVMKNILKGGTLYGQMMWSQKSQVIKQSLSARCRLPLYGLLVREVPKEWLLSFFSFPADSDDKTLLTKALVVGYKLIRHQAGTKLEASLLPGRFPSRRCYMQTAGGEESLTVCTALSHMNYSTNCQTRCAIMLWLLWG